MLDVIRNRRFRVSSSEEEEEESQAKRGESTKIDVHRQQSVTGLGTILVDSRDGERKAITLLRTESEDGKDGGVRDQCAGKLWL